MGPLTSLDRPAARHVVSDGIAAAWLHKARETGAGRIQASADTYEATAETVLEMCNQVAAAALDPEVRREARNAAVSFRGGPFYKGGDSLRDPAALAESCWQWAKHFIRFEHHAQTIRRLLNERNQLQLLISPSVLVRMEDRRGDCAIFTELICAFLTCLRVRWEIVTVAANPKEPGIFSHVYPRAVMPDGSRIALDASHGGYPGWQVPRAHTSRIQVWDMDGGPVSDLDSRWTGLHGYMGLGDTDLNSVWAGDVTDNRSFDSSGAYAGNTAAAGSGFNWGGFIGNLANQWTQIGSRVLAPSTTIQRGANGQLSIVTPGNSPVGSALIGASAGAGAALPSGLLWMGAAVVAVLVVSSMGKGRG